MVVVEQERRMYDQAENENTSLAENPAEAHVEAPSK
jgi:hypothetical protein